MLSGPWNFTCPGVLVRPDIEVTSLVAHSSFVELMTCSVILNYYFAAVLSREMVLACLNGLLTLVKDRIPPLISHRYMSDVERLLRPRNTKITLRSSESRAATRKFFVCLWATFWGQAEWVGPGVGVVDIGGWVGGWGEAEGVR